MGREVAEAKLQALAQGAALAGRAAPVKAPLRRRRSRRRAPSTRRCAEQGHAVLDPAGFARWAGAPLAGFEALRPSWDACRPTPTCATAAATGAAATRCFVVDGDERRAGAAPRALAAGGIQRAARRHRALVRAGRAGGRRAARPGRACCAMAGRARERAARARSPGTSRRTRSASTPTDGIGRPTPEGAHRDGVDLVAVILVGREGVKGGETRVFDADGPAGLRFTMSEPWSLLLLDDARVIHESTPIQPLERAGGHRDTLVLTARAGGFQGAS